MNKKDREIKRLKYELKILESLMKKDSITEFDDHYYSRAYRRYRDRLWILENSSLTTA